MKRLSIFCILLSSCGSDGINGTNGTDGTNGNDGVGCTVRDNAVICTDGNTHKLPSVQTYAPTKCVDLLNKYEIGDIFALQSVEVLCGAPVHTKFHGSYVCEDTYSWDFEDSDIISFKIDVTCEGVVESIRSYQKEGLV